MMVDHSCIHSVQNRPHILKRHAQMLFCFFFFQKELSVMSLYAISGGVLTYCSVETICVKSKKSMQFYIQFSVYVKTQTKYFMLMQCFVKAKGPENLLPCCLCLEGHLISEKVNVVTSFLKCSCLTDQIPFYIGDAPEKINRPFKCCISYNGDGRDGA